MRSINAAIATPSLAAISRKPDQNSASKDTLVFFPASLIECFMTGEEL